MEMTFQYEIKFASFSKVRGTEHVTFEEGNENWLLLSEMRCDLRGVR
jgi:hypothetical protein